MACGVTLKITETPILIGFQWDSSLTFATGTVASPIYVDLSLYDVEFAITPSATSTLSLVPTITKLSNGLATFRYTAAQTYATIIKENYPLVEALTSTHSEAREKARIPANNSIILSLFIYSDPSHPVPLHFPKSKTQ